MSYRPELPPVLRGLTFEVQGRHKVRRARGCGGGGCGSLPIWGSDRGRPCTTLCSHAVHMPAQRCRYLNTPLCWPLCAAWRKPTPAAPLAPPLTPHAPLVAPCRPHPPHPPRPQVGVCGRTGCGKSTLMMALYRLVEPRSGVIAIDGVDITSLGLYDLRSRLSLVPQVGGRENNVALMVNLGGKAQSRAGGQGEVHTTH